MSKNKKRLVNTGKKTKNSAGKNGKINIPKTDNNRTKNQAKHQILVSNSCYKITPDSLMHFILVFR
jgi:hypothetical protein